MADRKKMEDIVLRMQKIIDNPKLADKVRRQAVEAQAQAVEVILNMVRSDNLPQK